MRRIAIAWLIWTAVVWGQRPAPRRTAAVTRQAPALTTLAPLTLSDDDLARFAHRRPVAVAGVKVRSLLESAAVKSLLKQFLPAAQGTELAQVAGGVERVYVSFAPKESSTRSSYPEPDILVLATGDFSAGVPGFLQHGGGTSVYQVNPRTLLMGEPASAMAAYQRLRAKSGEAPLALAGDVAVRLDLTALPLDAIPQAASLPGAVREMRQFALSLDLQDGLRVEASLLMTTPEAAGRMLAELQAKLKESPEAAAALGKNLSVDLEGEALRIRAVVTQAEWEGTDWGRALASRPKAPAAPRKSVVHGQ